MTLHVRAEVNSNTCGHTIFMTRRYPPNLTATSLDKILYRHFVFYIKVDLAYCSFCATSESFTVNCICYQFLGLMRPHYTRGIALKRHLVFDVASSCGKRLLILFIF